MKKSLFPIIVSLLIHFLTANVFGAGNNDVKRELQLEKNLLLLKYHFNSPEILKAVNEKNDSDEIDNKNLTYKSPWLAFFFSMFLPTTGQIYNGDYTKALIQGGLILGGLGLVAGTVCVECGDTDGVQSALFFTGLGMAFSGYAWSIIDAPISASRNNSRINRQKGLTIIKSDNEKYTIKLNRDFFRNTYSLNLQVGL